MGEGDIYRAIMVALSKLGARVFRNQVGTYELKDGRWLSSGLCTGSSDLIGWHSVTITPEMVGRPVAIFVAIETKTNDRRSRTTQEQEAFINIVLQAGGISGVARSESEAIELISKGLHDRKAP